jgi:hypothetical protein
MGTARKKLTPKPSISGHAKLIADFINGIDPKRTSAARFPQTMDRLNYEAFW